MPEPDQLCPNWDTIPAVSISDAIRAEIERQGLTAYRVAKLAGLTPNIVSRFLSGERDITLATADKIFAALGLVVTRAGELPTERPAVHRAEDTVGTSGQALPPNPMTAGLLPRA